MGSIQRTKKYSKRNENLIKVKQVTQKVKQQDKDLENRIEFIRLYIRGQIQETHKLNVEALEEKKKRKKQ